VRHPLLLQITSVASLLTLLSGCSGGDPYRVAVAGHVQVDGTPLPRGTVQFVPDAGTPGPAVVAEVVAGKFELAREQGPITGDYQIEVYAAPNVEFDVTDDLAYAAAQAKSQKPLDLTVKKLRFPEVTDSRLLLIKSEPDLTFHVVAASRPKAGSTR
jgi:hypothetical protein